MKSCLLAHGGGEPADQAAAHLPGSEAAVLLALADAMAGLLEAAVQEVVLEGDAGLKQCAAVLRFAGQQGGAALVSLLAAVLVGRQSPAAASGDAASGNAIDVMQGSTGCTQASASSGTGTGSGGSTGAHSVRHTSNDKVLPDDLTEVIADCARLLQVALRSMAFGHAVPAAFWLPCWQRLALFKPEVDAHPCQLLSLSISMGNAEEILDDTAAGVSPAPPDALPAAMANATDRALLDFLRAGTDDEQQRAAQGMANVLAGIAAQQTDPQCRWRWRTWQAFAAEVSAGQPIDRARCQFIFAGIGRQVRLWQREQHTFNATPRRGYASAMPPDALLRASLYEIAQHPLLTDIAQRVAAAYALPAQFSGFLRDEQSSRWHLCDEDEVFEQTLPQVLASDAAAPAEPMAAGMARALAAALRACMAGIEHRIDAARELATPAGLVAEVSTLVRQIDAGVRMLNHAGLRAMLAEASVELDRLSQCALDDGQVSDPNRWQAFAAKLAVLEAGLATLPFHVSTMDRRACAPSGVATDTRTSIDTAADTDTHTSIDTAADTDTHTATATATATDNTTDATYAADRPSLQQIFAAEARSRLDSLRQSLAAWEFTPAAGLPAQALIDAHALAGSSATVGCDAIHVLARSLEQACERCLTLPSTAADAEVLADAIAAISILLDGGNSDSNRDSNRDSDSGSGSGSGSGSADDADAVRRFDTVLVDKLLGMDRAGGVEVVADDFAPELPDAELRAIFDEEAADLLPQLEQAMRAWLSRPDDPAPPAHLMRVLHTLKGSARMAGSPALGDVFHHLESRISDTLLSGGVTAGLLHDLQSELDDALGGIDRMRAAARAVAADGQKVMHEDGQAFPPEPAAAAPVAVETSLAAFQVTPVPEVGPEAMPEAGLATGTALSKVASTAASTITATASSISAERTAQPPAVSSNASVAAPPKLRVPVAQLARITDAAAELLAGGHQQTDEVLALRQGVADLADNLGRLRGQLRALEIEADTRIASQVQRGEAAGFDPLEFDRYTRVDELVRSMSESVADLAEVQRTLARQSGDLGWLTGQQLRQLRALHTDLLEVGTSPFASLEARLAQTLRQALRDADRMSGEQDRQDAEVSDTPQPQVALASHAANRMRAARLVMEGGELMVDRSLLERLAAPIEHLIRNAAAHGIEPAAERERSGKPHCACVRVRLTRGANQWQLEVADDGRGLDEAGLRARAAAMGQSSAPAMPAAELIFVRGLSTRERLSDLAGRGVGMDAVRATVQGLGGAIQVASEPGRGCRFMLSLPLTLAIMPVLVCRAGPHVIGLPSSMLLQVLKLDTRELADAVDGDELAWQGAAFCWRSLATMLGVAVRAPARRTTVLLLSQADQRLALAVDAVDARRELTLRDPNPQWLSVPGLIGASPVADGGIVLVMNPFALMEAVRPAAASQHRGVATEITQDLGSSALPGAGLQAPVAPSTPAALTILVVDDSLTVRRASQRLLQRQGYSVLLARDGTEALAQLTAAEADPDARGDVVRPQLVLLDIEMPKMDGFELLRLLRGDVRWQHLPVVMLTSRTADKHRERALQLGATAYVGKPYREEALLALLSDLLVSDRTAHEPPALMAS